MLELRDDLDKLGTNEESPIWIVGALEAQHSTGYVTLKGLT